MFNDKYINCVSSLVLQNDAKIICRQSLMMNIHCKSENPLCKTIQDVKNFNSNPKSIMTGSHIIFQN